MIAGIGKGIEFVSPLIGWATGRLVGNIVKVEVPPIISNTIMEQGAKYGESLFGKIGLGRVGYWIGKGIGLYQGVNTASSPFVKGMVGIGALLANTATTVAVTTLFNKAGQYLQKKGEADPQELKRIEEILFVYQDLINDGHIPAAELEDYMRVMARQGDFSAEGLGMYMEFLHGKLKPEVNKDLPALRELPPVIEETPIEEPQPIMTPVEKVIEKFDDYFTRKLITMKQVENFMNKEGVNLTPENLEKFMIEQIKAKQLINRQQRGMLIAN